MLRNRYIREMRQPLSAVVSQRLIWLEGEALCVTPEFRADHPRTVPRELLLARLPASLRGVVQATLKLRRPALLRRRQQRRPWSRLWSWLTGRRLSSPEFLHASLLFRLQRHAIPAPRLLAFGERLQGTALLQSFLLMEPLRDALPLAQWRPTRAHQRAAQRELENLLQRLHQVGCVLESRLSDEVLGLFAVVSAYDGEPAVVLNDVAGLRVVRRPGPRRLQRDRKILERAMRRVVVREEFGRSSSSLLRHCSNMIPRSPGGECVPGAACGFLGCSFPRRCS